MRKILLALAGATVFAIASAGTPASAIPAQGPLPVQSTMSNQSNGTAIIVAGIVIHAVGMSASSVAAIMAVAS
jgi:hypothetical protein